MVGNREGEKKEGRDGERRKGEETSTVSTKRVRKRVGEGRRKKVLMLILYQVLLYLVP